MNSSLSVYQIIASIDSQVGGTSTFMEDICASLVEEPVDLTLVSGDYQGGQLIDLDPRINLQLLSATGRYSTEWNIKRECRDFLDASSANVQIVHVHGIWLGICNAACLFADRAKKPLVVSPHGMLDPWALNNRRLKKSLAWALYQKRDLARAAAFHACSEMEAEHIRKLGFTQPIAVIPNGVYMPTISNGMVAKPKVKRALFLSRINRKKGLPMLVEAWARVAPSSWELVIAGNDDDNHLSVVQDKIKEFGLGDSVKLIGYVSGDAKRSVFENSDLFILPSYSENFGIAVAEAMAYSLPVLTTKACPWQELETKKCGWWVEPTLDDVSKGLSEAVNTPDSDLENMGKRAKELIKDNYQWPAIADKMHQLYSWLSGQSKCPSFVR